MKDPSLFSLFLMLMTIVIVLMLGLATVGNAMPESQAVQAMFDLGFDGVSVTGRHVFLLPLRGCSWADVVKFDVTVLNHAGKRVRQSVCMGLGNEATLSLR